MTAPIDVLAVLARLLAVANDDVQDHDEVTAIYAQGVEARAAIAKLIEAAKSVAWNASQTAPEDHYHEVGRDDMEALIAAVANVSGGDS